jgi:hypothetical protein
MQNDPSTGGAIMKKLVILLGLLVILVVPGVAAGHQVGDRYDYYWKEGRAEQKLYNRFDDVIDVTCKGYGKHLSGGYYRHHRCVAETDTEYIKVIVHVTGPNTYRITFP